MTINCPHCKEAIEELDARTVTFDVHSIMGRKPDGSLDLEIARVNPSGFVDVDYYLCPECAGMIDERGNKQDKF